MGGRRNRRRGCRELSQDTIRDILADNPSETLRYKTLPRAADPNAAVIINHHAEPSPADQAYTHAVETCDSIIAELDEYLSH